MLPAASLRLAVTLAACLLASLPAAALAAPPGNDGYLDSIPVNARGSELPDGQVKDVKDTREATVQADMFSPAGTGGGVERTDCRGTSYGATIWYDFHPQADGVMGVLTSGPDAAIAIYEFDPRTNLIGDRLDCSNEAGSSDELYVRVRRATSYTVQIGGSDVGFGPAVGDLETRFEYFSDTDRDGTLDALDKCPDQAGTSNGCPVELRALPTLRAARSGSGVKVISLSVSVAKGVRVRVRCRGGCSFAQSRTALAAGPVRFPGLAGRQLPAGARLEVYVTKRDTIGSYFRYTITRGSFTRIERCMRPGSTTPRRSCT